MRYSAHQSWCTLAARKTTILTHGGHQKAHAITAVVNCATTQRHLTDIIWKGPIIIGGQFIDRKVANKTNGRHGDVVVFDVQILLWDGDASSF